MRQKFILAIVFVMLMLGSTTAYAQRPTEFLVREYSLAIEVYCMDKALAAMAQLPGIELSSQMRMDTGRGTATRIVPNIDRNNALAQLQQMGAITRSDTQSTNMFTAWVALYTELAVRNQEYDRLMILLSQVATLEEFEQVERSLQTVIARRETIWGQLNSLEFQLGSSVIAISLTFIPPYVPYEITEPDTEPTVFGRITDAFTRSIMGTFTVLQTLVLFGARISLPFMVWCMVGTIILICFSRISRRKVGLHEKA